MRGALSIFVRSDICRTPILAEPCAPALELGMRAYPTGALEAKTGVGGAGRGDLERGQPFHSLP